MTYLLRKALPVSFHPVAIDILLETVLALCYYHYVDESKELSMGANDNQLG